MKKATIFILTLLLSVFSISTVMAQLNISGTVTESATGVPLPGANIVVKGTNLGTSTDLSGDFNLRLENFTEATLVVSFIGYKTQEITVSSSMSGLNIMMEEDVLKTSEIVVTGLSTSVKRRNLANSVGTISAKELIPAPAQTLERAFNGKIAGMTVRQNTGAPGGGISVNLRGTSTIQGSTEPLWVIDGVIVSNAAIQSGMDIITEAAGQGSRRPQGQPTNRIADINPNDIENIEILKGPSAAALYGSKASNGVIIITTKQGIAGKTTVDFSQQIGFNTILQKIGFYRYPGSVYVDYEDELYGETGLMTESTLSIRGGNESTKFYIGGLYQDEDSIVKKAGYRKSSGRININHTFSDRLRLSASTSFTRTESDRGITGNDNTLTSFGFSLAFLHSDVDLRQRADGSYPAPAFPSNPLQTRDLFINNEAVNRSISSLKLDWNLFRSQAQKLDFIMQTGVDFFSMKNTIISPPELYYEQIRGAANAGRSISGLTESTNSNLYLHLNYSYNPSTRLIFRTSAGLQFENQNVNNILVTSIGLLSTQTNVDQAASSTAGHNRIIQRERGFFIQEEVDFDDKIFLTAGLRGDASSSHGDTDKFFLYPKFSAAVRLSQYADLSSFADELKLRVAYGETGNSPPPFAKFTSLAQANTGGLLGTILPITLGSPTIKPERSKEIEVGLDATFLNENATLEFSYFRQNIEDLILIAQIPPSSGSPQKWGNLGEMRTQGVEISLGMNLIRKRNINWSSRINFFTFNTEITKLDVPSFTQGAFGLGLGTFQIKEGEDPHDIVLGSVTNVVGNESPDFQVSFNNTFSLLQKFELSFLWDWRQGGEVINLGMLLTDIGGTTDDFNTPAFDARGASGNYVESASYVKLRELSLTYSVPQSFISDMFAGQLSYIRLGIAGRNLLMFTDYRGYDPEVSQFGNLAVAHAVDTSPFPSARNFYFNISVGF